MAGGLGSGCTACRPPPPLMAELFQMVELVSTAWAVLIEIAPPASPALFAEKLLLWKTALVVQPII